MNDKFYVTECPLGHPWPCEPEPTAAAAKEARRKHLQGHSHGELVEFIESIAAEAVVYGRERSEFLVLSKREDRVV